MSAGGVLSWPVGLIVKSMVSLIPVAASLSASSISSSSRNSSTSGSKDGRSSASVVFCFFGAFFLAAGGLAADGLTADCLVLFAYQFQQESALEVGLEARLPSRGH